MVLAAEAGAIEPGTEAETVVLVRNTGEQADAFHVAVRGEAAPWAAIDPPLVTLDPGEEAPVWVRFRPPRSPSTLPGPVAFSVVVSSREHPESVTVETGVLQVGTFSSIDAAVTAERTFGTRGSGLVLSVHNVGNRRVTMNVVAEATGRGVTVEVEPDELDLVPDGRADVAVRVLPPRWMLPGRSVDRGLVLAVVSDGGALATVRTEYPAEASLQQELLRSLRVLGVVLVLLIVGGLALLRSDADSSKVDVRPGPTSVPTPSPTTSEEATAGEAVATPAGSQAKGAAAAPSLPPLVFLRQYGPSVVDIVVREAGARSNELRLRADAIESQPHLSPDRNYVAFIRERDATWRVCVVATTGGEPVCVADTTAGTSVAWAADGRSLVFSRGGQLVSVAYDPATQTEGQETVLGVEVPGNAFALSPDGTRIVVADGRKLLVRPVDGQPGLTVDVPGPAEDPSWSPDGTRVVYTSNYQIYVAPVGGGPVRQLTANGTVNGDATWTGEGDWVVFRSNRSGGGDLYAVKGSSSAGSETGLAQVTSTNERETTPAF